MAEATLTTRRLFPGTLKGGDATHGAAAKHNAIWKYRIGLRKREKGIGNCQHWHVTIGKLTESYFLKAQKHLRLKFTTMRNKHDETLGPDQTYISKSALGSSIA